MRCIGSGYVDLPHFFLRCANAEGALPSCLYIMPRGNQALHMGSSPRVELCQEVLEGLTRRFDLAAHADHPAKVRSGVREDFFSPVSYETRLEIPAQAPEKDNTASAAACCSSCKHHFMHAEMTQPAVQHVLTSGAHTTHEQPVLSSQGF